VDLELFDVQAYLNSKGIKFSQGGKNVSEEWIGVRCPFPLCGDKSNHLGIHVYKKTISCWKCGTTGTIVNYIKEIEGNVSIRAILERFSSKVYHSIKNKKSTKFERSNSVFSIQNIVNRYEQELHSLHETYLQHRGLVPAEIVSKYDVGCVGPVGKYKYRLIIPIYMNRALVCFSSRDVTEQANQPYDHCPNEVALIPAKECLYNMDNAEGTALVVEGIFDVWNIGDGAVATLGTKYTMSQLAWLSNFDRVFILFDYNASNKAEKLAHDLSANVNHVEIMFLDEGDPGEMSKPDVKSLRKQVFGKIY